MGFFGNLFRDPANPNRALEQLMAELARANDPDVRRKFYRELLAGSLFVAVPGVIESSMPSGDDEAPAPFITSRDANNAKILPAFTGKEALLNWRRAGCDTKELKVPELCVMALDAKVDAIAINPFGPSGTMLNADVVRSLSERRIPGFFI